MSNYLFTYPFTFTILLLFAVGCGNNVSVTGKVTLKDGTPVTGGMVLFEAENMVAQGRLQKNGTYCIRSGEKKGLPRGTYKVSLGGFDPTYQAPPMANGRPTGRPIITPQVILFDKKYMSANLSGLTCNVKRSMKFDLELDPAK